MRSGFFQFQTELLLKKKTVESKDSLFSNVVRFSKACLRTLINAISIGLVSRSTLIIPSMRGGDGRIDKKNSPSV